jgi:hypothetical protein
MMISAETLQMAETEHEARLAAMKARAEAAEKVLAALVLWKDYKDAHGKDATYEAGKDEAWASARAALEPKP